MSTNKQDIWDRNEATDPAYTKQFNRGGGFKGTATNITYLIKRATAEFGPCGEGFGWEVASSDYIQGASIDDNNREIVHVLQINFWWMKDGERRTFPSFGQTTFVGKNKYGPFTDEEAPKKSLSDAISKALSYLGFAADIHLGLYDDNKYMAEVRQKFAEPQPKSMADRVRENLGATEADDPLKDWETSIIEAVSERGGGLDDAQTLIRARMRRERANNLTNKQYEELLGDIESMTPAKLEEVIEKIGKKSA